MKAVVYNQFQQQPHITKVNDPTPAPNGVVIKVKATGICLSDWHGWMGHDPDIKLPHIPGHELAGEVVAVGRDVCQWHGGERVTLPFVGGCGHCGQCESGNQQVCDNQFQPGFTHWGSFAEYVAIDYADVNLVHLPDTISYVTAASLGCRFATSYRAMVAQGRVTADQWIAIYGCGGVGLSAVMIASALGAKVIAIDISEAALSLAQSVGASHVINATTSEDPVALVRELSSGGVEVSLDALGSVTTCSQSIASLKKRGKHIQVGLMAEDQGNANVLMSAVIANELEIIGSHGMQAHAYDEMLTMIEQGQLEPQKLTTEQVSLEQAIPILTSMDRFTQAGIRVIDQF